MVWCGDDGVVMVVWCGDDGVVIMVWCGVVIVVRCGGVVW